MGLNHKIKQRKKGTKVGNLERNSMNAQYHQKEVFNTQPTELDTYNP